MHVAWDILYTAVPGQAWYLPDWIAVVADAWYHPVVLILLTNTSWLDEELAGHYSGWRARSLSYYCNMTLSQEFKNFSQWECSFHWKLRCHWLEFLRQGQIAVVRQGPATLDHMLFYHSTCVDRDRLCNMVVPNAIGTCAFWILQSSWINIDTVDEAVNIISKDALQLGQLYSLIAVRAPHLYFVTIGVIDADDLDTNSRPSQYLNQWWLIS